MTHPERTLLTVVSVVERLGADERLRDAVALINAARQSVGDYIDGVPRRRRVVVDE